MAVLRVCLCALLLLVQTEGAQVTPMEKVITLLKGLSAKVAADGKKEAAQYDKYACFCKEQADEKLYAIEKSDDRLASLKAQIGQLTSTIAELNTEISDLSKKISGLETDIKERTEKRAGERATYEAKAKDMNEAIEACAAAISALKDSKTSMSGAKLDLAQVQKATRLASSSPAVVALLSELEGKGAPKFEYQSNDIIATLDGLLAQFKSLKVDLDTEEHDTNSAFESTKLGLSNEKTFAAKERDEKEAINEANTEKLEGAKTDRDEEQKNRDADDSFMKDLTSDCEEKAGLFDQRSKTRADELTAINDATAELQKGAVPNFEANKNLVGLQKKAVVHKAVIAPVPVSFVQINNVKNSGQEVVVQKVLDLLHGAAGRTGSAMLANAAMRVKMAEDHFVKVRALVKDLIAKLEADALSEASQKSTCDKGMKNAIADRDRANSEIEMAQAKITTLTSQKEELIANINQLNSDIAGLKKGLLEATELRNTDEADHAKTTSMSDEAIESVKLALGLLKDFYDKAALAQTGKYVPPNSGRDGKTVGDLAPEVFGSEYKGEQGASKGIVGILEVILSDFERTKKQTADDEEESKTAYETLEKETNEDVGKKEKSIETKEGELTEAKSNIIDRQTDLSEAKDLLESSTGALDGLKAMCVAGEETWEERKQKREEEIEALKNAMEILTNWQN